MKRGLILVVVMALALGATARSESAVRGGSSLRCPGHAPQLRGAGKLGGSGKGFAQAKATILLLCRYRGLNASAPLGLARARRITSLPTISKLTRALNSVPVKGRGIFACPFDDGREILLRFGYRRRGPERVLVGLRGCMAITNGKAGTLGLLSRDGSRFVHRLRALT